MSERVPYGNMTCTECFRDAGPSPEFHGMTASQIQHVCSNYKCGRCLDDAEAVVTATSGAGKQE